MSLKIASLNSGSNGNCYYIGNGNEAVLVDAGISCRETERRLNRLDLDIRKVKAIFISHEHSDHISGATVLSSKYQLPVYITETTHRLSRLRLEKKLINRFRSGDSIRVGALSITAFSKFHDAGDPHSFMVAGAEVKVGIFTDIGTACRQLIRNFKQCHAAFLEANYDEDMLMNGSYPYVLKKRISDGQGHLSNKEALELFRKHRPPFMSHLILSHLSENNNRPDLVKELFNMHARGTRIIIASRNQETEVFEIHSSHRRYKKTNGKENKRQLSLF